MFLAFSCLKLLGFILWLPNIWSNRSNSFHQFAFKTWQFSRSGDPDSPSFLKPLLSNCNLPYFVMSPFLSTTDSYYFNVLIVLPPLSCNPPKTFWFSTWDALYQVPFSRFCPLDLTVWSWVPPFLLVLDWATSNTYRLMLSFLQSICLSSVKMSLFRSYAALSITL